MYEWDEMARRAMTGSQSRFGRPVVALVDPAAMMGSAPLIEQQLEGLRGNGSAPPFAFDDGRPSSLRNVRPVTSAQEVLDDDASVLVITDGFDGWANADFLQTVTELAHQRPVFVSQLLPQRFWDFTNTFHPPVEGMVEFGTGSNLHFSKPREYPEDLLSGDKGPFVPGIVLPVLDPTADYFDVFEQGQCGHAFTTTTYIAASVERKRRLRMAELVWGDAGDLEYLRGLLDPREFRFALTYAYDDGRTMNTHQIYESARRMGLDPIVPQLFILSNVLESTGPRDAPPDRQPLKLRERYRGAFLDLAHYYRPGRVQIDPHDYQIMNDVESGSGLTD